jgi:acetaldehyde dehydrogenase (acetylating)
MNENGVVVLSIRVKGTGDYLPEYAGNLDIINCAAIKITEKLSQNI